MSDNTRQLQIPLSATGADGVQPCHVTATMRDGVNYFKFYKPSVRPGEQYGILLTELQDQHGIVKSLDVGTTYKVNDDWLICVLSVRKI